ncbi:PEP-CTERM sorting domain-containing protein [Elioraea sp.]|uniref:PEP-CTERM sorting domain-containing protein n=1 Tax=Elioraea sp. TaxID=2185103 RepID=UPI0025C4A43B|nr:PEP-CTERM sorting domain-containing protein [Elioraea sp.]
MGGFLHASLAVAAPILHDSEASFASIVYTPGINSTLGQVAAGRRVLGNMFDATNSTMLSLGLGGSIAFLIAPEENSITGASTFELTNLGSGHKERARLFLGNDLGGWIEIGDLLNQELGSTVTNVNPTVATLALTTPGAATGFTLTVLDGSFNSLRLLDVSPTRGANLDGFDIASFSLTSIAPPTPPPVPVPEPATWLLLVGGIAGLAAARRRFVSA